MINFTPMLTQSEIKLEMRKKKIAENIQLLRHSENLTLEQAADKCNLPVWLLDNYENAVGDFSYSALRNIAIAFNCSITNLTI
jgi:transcriptional regulator with XRE-family HTH domain